MPKTTATSTRLRRENLGTLRPWTPPPTGRPIGGLSGWHRLPRDMEPIQCSFERVYYDPRTDEVTKVRRCSRRATWAKGTGIRDRFYCGHHRRTVMSKDQRQEAENG